MEKQKTHEPKMAKSSDAAVFDFNFLFKLFLYYTVMNLKSSLTIVTHFFLPNKIQYQKVSFEKKKLFVTSILRLSDGQRIKLN